MPDPIAAAHAPSLAARVSQLKPSVTVALGAKARDLKRQGVDVLSFTLGEPDFDTPAPIKQAAIDALNAGETHYSATLGTPEARAAIANKLTRENGIPGLTPEHVAISAGVKHSLYVLFQCLVDQVPAGDEAEVLVPVPTWVSYKPLAELAGARVVEIETDREDSYRLDPTRLADAITPRSRVLVLNTPSNPCATQHTEADLRALAEVIAQHPQLVVLSDEIYEKIVYGGIKHFSIGSIPEIADRVVTLNGMSKAFAMTGWRIGYAACPGAFGLRLIKAMASLQGQMTTNITSFIYPAIPVALTRCEDEVAHMVEAFAARARLTSRLLSEIPGLRFPTPTGAFYAFCDVSAHFGKTSAGGRLIDSPTAFADALLEEQQVAVIPGEDFGGDGRNCLRISFACSETQIERGMERLAKFVSGLR